MKPIDVGVIGYDQIGKRVADAICRQPDLRLAGVHEIDSQRIKVLRARGIPLAVGDPGNCAAEWGVAVVCQDNAPALSLPCVYSPEVDVPYPLFSATVQSPSERRLRVGCADAVAFARLLMHLPAVERVFSSCARRVGHATDHALAMVDALEPLFELSCEDADVRAMLATRVRDVYVRRTHVPYTHSHLHHLKLDLTEPTTRDAVLDALRRAPRVRVAPGADCFPDTGHLQEYCRDLGLPRGDRTQVFVWKESVAVVERTVFLTADVSPDATPIPDVIDAVRCLARPDISLAEASRVTDRSLDSWS